MARIALQSTSLNAATYQDQSAFLELEFRGGVRYRYLGVPEQVYRELLSAESKGNYFNQHIRNRFTVGVAAAQRLAGGTPGCASEVGPNIRRSVRSGFTSQIAASWERRAARDGNRDFPSSWFVNAAPSGRIYRRAGVLTHDLQVPRNLAGRGEFNALYQVVKCCQTIRP
jgi:hypothetical protein